MEKEMNEKNTKKREWVKTAAIIFLSVMLVLTFFSQTIMNYSLPIVAAQYVNSGSITAKVRGTGVIEAADPYNVVITESRVISSVAVKQGDVVEKDQVLFYLEDKESDELKAAEKTLDEMLLSFKKSLLAGDVSNSVINNAQNGVESSTATYQSKITEAQKKYDALEAQVADLEKQISLLSINGETENQLIDSARNKLSDAQAVYTTAETALNAIVSSMKFVTKEEAQSNMDGLKTVADAYLLPMQEKESTMNQAKEVQDAILAVKAAKEEYEKDTSNVENKRILLEKISVLKTLDSSILWNESTDINTILSKLSEKNSAYTAAAEEFTTAKTTYDTAYATYEEAKTQYDLFAQKEQASATLNSAKANLDAAQKKYNEAINNKNNGSSSSLNDLNKKLKEVEYAKKNAEENLNQLLLDIGKELELGAQNEAIVEQRQLVEELRSKAVGAEVKAPVAGTVSSLNIVAGETTNPANPLAVIQPDGKGFSLNFSVTADQAKKLTPGEPAEIQNAWYYDEISASLAQIKNDPENPGKNKLLVFDIQGDVMGGQQLSLSIGQKSANYDLIVPNSAIREDNNGKFILTVESKSSPLGNRYVATRVDIEVLASDDTQSAVSGALYGYEYVITTSNKPVEAGKQVRLSDN